MTDDIFDFGFTAVSEDDLQVVESSRSQVEDMESQVKELDKRANDLYNAILPLLENLKKNPEKDYLYWPNRVDAVNKFEQVLRDIMVD